MNNIIIDSIKNYEQLIKTEKFGYMIGEEINLFNFDEDVNISFSNTPTERKNKYYS